MLALFAGRPGPRIQGKLHPEKTQVFPIGPGFDSPHLHHLDAHFDTKPGEVGQRVRMGVFACCGGFLAVGGSCGGLQRKWVLIH